MSEKSFAVISVLSAVILGAFFYPPAPRKPAKPANTLPAVPPVAAEPAQAAHAPSQWSALASPARDGVMQRKAPVLHKTLASPELR